MYMFEHVQAGAYKQQHHAMRWTILTRRAPGLRRFDVHGLSAYGLDVVFTVVWSMLIKTVLTELQEWVPKQRAVVAALAKRLLVC